MSSIYESKYEHLKHLTPINLNNYLKSKASAECDYELDCFEVNVYNTFIPYFETEKILNYFKDCPLLVNVIMRDGLVKVCMKFDIEEWSKQEWVDNE